ncbi:amidohydrolase 2 [Kribbella flavida DSM 17836]|uniref:Amidohydrolase 2 n=1 Tax=Kribbella flavida (strain DSM 17836 / JCM 10339 / NBRC 14399) TaxID=479435 RepID=D2PMU1_KRIFD|nr:amidohydrolase family protein [Kribbella flavida]ADB32643.1 amidohydrolase 2 [Kribbella flavida DSM 17836]
MTVDAHHHFWQVAAQEQPWRDERHGAIARDYSPDDLAAELAVAGVERTVLIQSVDEPAENDRLLRYAAQAPYVGAVVGWLPLAEPRTARREIARVADDLGGFAGRFSGVRCLVGRDPLEWLSKPAAVELFRELAAAGISWDVVPVTAEQTKAVLGLADAVPELRIVVDHLGRPPIDTGGWEPWAGQVRQLAECRQVAMKVSLGIDLLTELRQWPDLERYLDRVVECFGARRLMLASNWPVVLLRASYAEAWSRLRTAVEHCLHDPDERTAVLGGTAADYYRINGKVSR